MIYVIICKTTVTYKTMISLSSLYHFPWYCPLMYIILYVSLALMGRLNLEPLPLIIDFFKLVWQLRTTLRTSTTISKLQCLRKAQLSYSNTKLLPPRARAKFERSPRFRKSQKWTLQEPSECWLQPKLAQLPLAVRTPREMAMVAQ